MSDFFMRSPSSPLALTAVLDTLAEIGYHGLTLHEVRMRAGAAGTALDADVDLDSLVVAALEHVQLFPDPTPTGHLRQDLRTLLQPWRRGLRRDERAVAALLSPAARSPRLRIAVYEALDRPLTHAVAAIAARATGEGDVPARLIQTLCWVLRGLMTDRLRSTPRSAVDIELLVAFLMAGLQAAPTHGPDSRAPDALERATEAGQA